MERRRNNPSALANHCAGDARPGIAGGLGLVVVGVAMDDEAAADEVGARAADGNAFELERRRGVAIGVRHQAGHVTRMMIAALRAVRLAGGIEMPAGAHAIARAAIALLVHVEAMLGARLQSGDVGAHADLVAVLREGHRSPRGVSGRRLEGRYGRGLWGKSQRSATGGERRDQPGHEDPVHYALRSHFFFGSSFGFSVPLAPVGLGAGAALPAAGGGAGWAGAAATIGVGLGTGLCALRLVALEFFAPLCLGGGSAGLPLSGADACSCRLFIPGGRD